MLHHNPTPNTLRFELADKRYHVPPGAEVDVPDHLAYAIRERQTPHDVGPSPVKVSEAKLTGLEESASGHPYRSAQTPTGQREAVTRATVEKVVPTPPRAPKGLGVAKLRADGGDLDAAIEGMQRQARDASDEFPDRSRDVAEPSEDEGEPSPQVASAAEALKAEGVDLPGPTKVRRKG
jgi:hypothetical protein